MQHEQGFLRIRDVLELIPVGRSTWWAGVKKGRFPKPVKLGPRTTVWRVKDINEFIKNPNQELGKPEDSQCEEFNQ